MLLILNQRRSDDDAVYDITDLDAAQQQVLSALGLEQLADDEHLRRSITARPPVPSASPKRKQDRGSRRQRL